MPSFGKASRENLGTCTSGIKRVMEAAIEEVDFSVLYGYRGERIQTAAYEGGYSTKPWPTSKHNVVPSRAIDILPYPSGWPQDDDSKQVKAHKIAHFYYQAGIVMSHAKRLGVKLRWGGDWDQDKDFLDQTFDDLAHFEEIG